MWCGFILAICENFQESKSDGTVFLTIESYLVKKKVATLNISFSFIIIYFEESIGHKIHVQVNGQDIDYANEIHLFYMCEFAHP